MKIEGTSRTGITIFRLVGKFDVSETPGFETVLKDLQRIRPKAAGIDLSEVPYVDSAGIGALIKAMQATKSGGGELIVYGITPPVMNVFESAGLSKFFKFMSVTEFNKKFPAAG